MKLDERFHCFGCGADGDVIDFVAQMFSLSPQEAAHKIIQDFGLGPGTPAPEPPPRPSERRCRDVLLQMEVALRKQKQTSMPRAPADPITNKYTEKCQMYEYIVCLADLLSGGTNQQKKDLVAYLTGDVLDRYEQTLRKGVIRPADIFGL